ncbi:MAG: helix-turn-helix domain-containing protein [Oribacterium sp.]|nr:helix-turn-helix domain-containing protein [Oribacterium sp.]
MEQEKKHEIALMRYSAIAPLIADTAEEYSSMTDYYTSVSQKGLKGPDGKVRHYAAGTIEKWYLAYKKSGFDALIPEGRSDCGKSRKIDEDLREEILYLKHTCPRLSAAAIYRQLQDKGSIRAHQLSESTILRCIHQIERENRLTNNQDMRLMNARISMKYGAETPVSVRI